MTPTQAQDLIDTFGKAVFLNQMDQELHRDALLDAVNKILADRAMLLTALKHLLEDTQHAEHEDCEVGPCCVREARAAIAQCEGTQP